mmetsp:Transcript_4024/g.5286  ORF Transcript_4024/g.5286 Transcript_4024/m.5286 type:complete len:239 (+) Transcript_4024:281-997(+)|eukprot:CAMPEP_0198140046 /NCGR_PEP_ID=MMETSP1443-20131203/3237_1 /TAXON_ID=186043 /ORGANISM="Entomoneis sp., Strain CCMP2396" /LENGTH=238 /DNA_ID=CAMNT_0043802355 /DNA_START=56 /DNA_END=772 /DNA_ORIENTATION=-
MKLFSVLVLSFSFAVQAFGVSSDPALSRKNALTKPSTAFHKSKEVVPSSAGQSPLFRDPAVVRGGAVPGWNAYNNALDEKPILTKAMTSLVGWALGDLLAQIFIVGGPIDWKRFATLSAFGFLWHGPSGHYFYNWLDDKIPGTTGKIVAMKVAIDQIIWCPIFMTVFFSYLGLMNGDSMKIIGNKIKHDLLPACQGSWKVWVFVHAINFKFISTKHRLVFINTIQIAFNMFLSMIGSK